MIHRIGDFPCHRGIARNAALAMLGLTPVGSRLGIQTVLAASLLRGVAF